MQYNVDAWQIICVPNRYLSQALISMILNALLSTISVSRYGDTWAMGILIKSGAPKHDGQRAYKIIPPNEEGNFSWLRKIIH